MTNTDYLTKPYGDRDQFDLVEREAFDWLMEHGGEGGANAVKSLAELLRLPRCPDCYANTICYGCASGGGPGADLVTNPGEPA